MSCAASSSCAVAAVSYLIPSFLHPPARRSKPGGLGRSGGTASPAAPARGVELGGAVGVGGAFEDVAAAGAAGRGLLPGDGRRAVGAGGVVVRGGGGVAWGWGLVEAQLPLHRRGRAGGVGAAAAAGRRAARAPPLPAPVAGP